MVKILFWSAVSAWLLLSWSPVARRVERLRSEIAAASPAFGNIQDLSR